MSNCYMLAAYRGVQKNQLTEKTDGKLTEMENRLN